MKKLKGNEIRKMWLDFWKSKNHLVIPSASLIPDNDPTLLWINAGVAPLKKYFDGREIPENKRMCNAQKSIRTNDIDNVGRTARHHTFFEMLGNFSIGDYFREKAIKWAIELLCDEKWFGMPIDKLYITYYPDDVDTYKCWINEGIKEDHLLAVKGNFWEIGEGPCGPDTEIFFDRGVKYDKDNLGTKLIVDDIDNERFIEIWNIVLSQFNSKQELKREEYKELPSKNIDTGMGLERMTAVLQEVETNYDTDLFIPIINKIETISNIKYQGQMAFKVISDHVRSTVFAISDGASFSNEGRGYVLRRLLRRAALFGRKIGIEEPFLYKLVPNCVNHMKEFYSYLEEKQDLVIMLIKTEEQKFLSTLASGEKKLKSIISKTKGNKISGKNAFLLYDTFGFPIELTIEEANEKGKEVDKDEFNELLKQQKERARNARGDIQSMNTQNEEMMKFDLMGEFIGYDNLQSKSKVIAILKDYKRCKEESGKLIIVFDKTPFYPAMGGQIGDTGIMTLNNQKLNVIDSQKMPNGCPYVIVDTSNVKVKVGDEALLEVDKLRREFIQGNHSATHLLNAALREVLGSHVHQQGSYVSFDRLRFDFNNFSFPQSFELLKIEEIVKDKIKQGIKVETKVMPISDARKTKAEAEFGEKYGEFVRVVDMDYSIEFCGGTHVSNTKDIDDFAILGIENKGSGIYRIEATTSKYIPIEIHKQIKSIEKNIENQTNKIIQISKKLDKKIELLSPNKKENSYKYILDIKKHEIYLKEELKRLDKELKKKQDSDNSISLDDYVGNIQETNNINTLVISTKDQQVNLLKDLADRIADKYQNIVIFIANVSQGKIVFICKNKNTKLNAGKIVREAAILAGGNGGGRPDFAQAGGKDVSKLNVSLDLVNKILKEQL